jgi:sortase (surface protein transpeptidase)
MTIPKLGVSAPVEPLTVNDNNEMDTPAHGHENTYVGWYDSTLKPQAPFLGVKPGWDGNAVFAAHVYYISSAVCPNNPNACPAPFQRLTTLKEGDEVDVSMEGGPTYKYKVITYNQYSRDTIPMGDIISPPTQPKDKQWITLITCGGDLDSSGLEYVSREVVVAERYE